MTSAQTMQRKPSLERCAVLAPALLIALFLGLAGCETLREKDELTQASVTVAPYDEAIGEVLWAVIPLANESGTELVDPLVISDKVVAAAEEIEGVRTVPLNRTLQAMHAAGVKSVRTPSEVRQLAAQMGVDGVILGTITAYDPYAPPKLGLTLALQARTDAMGGDPINGATIDSRELTSSPTGHTPSGAFFADRPAAVVSANLDASNHNVLKQVREYASGRHDPVSAMGWTRYTASMDLYTEFAAHHMVARLIAQEQARLKPLAMAQDEETP